MQVVLSFVLALVLFVVYRRARRHAAAAERREMRPPRWDLSARAVRDRNPRTGRWE